MRSNCQASLRYLTIVIGRKRKDQLLAALVNEGAQLITSSYGMGTADPHYILEALGLVVEAKKTVITCLIKTSQQEQIFQLLANDFHFDRPNTGVAYTTAVGEVSY